MVAGRGSTTRRGPPPTLGDPDRQLSCTYTGLDSEPSSTR